ncbi:MAG: PqqD family peptide modification chaperone [Thermodesulfobacteriota bacterium]
MNKTAVLVLEACTGKNSAADIVAIVKYAYDLQEAPEKEVSDCLKSLLEEGLVQ